MSRRFLTPAKIVNLTSDPASATEGEIYYNSTSKKLRYYTGTAWSDFGSGASGGTGQYTGDALPSSPTLGDIWFNTSTGKTYVYYDSYWIEVGTSEAARPIQLSGDVIAYGSDNIVTTLAPSGVVAGTYGSETSIPIINVDIKGRVTSASVANISTTLNGLFDVSITGIANRDLIQWDTATSRWKNTSFSGTANEIEVTKTASSIVVGLPDDVTIGNNLTVTGNLTVNGTTTIVNSTVVTIDDPILTLGGDTAPASNDSKDRGIEFRYYDTQARLGFMGWDNSANAFVFLTQATNTSEVYSGTKATIDANLSGSNINAGVVGATVGGTGQTSYAVGDLLYASTTTALSKLADVATGNVLLSGGVGVAPSYGKVGLTTHITGTLGTANGGTNLTSFTANGAVYATSTSALTTGTLPVTSGGTGVTTSTGSTNVVLSNTPTIVTPVIDSISASAATATPSLWPTVTTGTISIGAGLTTGSLDLATVGTGATGITIGHTNAVLDVISTGFNLSAAGALTLTSTIAASGLAGSLLSSTVGSTPAATASAGTSTIPARADHVHLRELPAQTGNSGLFLTTNGTSPSWAAVIGSVYQSTAPTNTTGAIWTDSDNGVLYQYNGTAWISPMNIEIFTPTFTTNNYTPILADQNRLLLLSNGSTAGTFTVPSAVNYIVGTQIQIVQSGIGQITITPQAITTATYASGGAAGATTFVISAANASIQVGQLVTGTGFAANTLVTAVSSTTITVSNPITSQVSGTITFSVGVVSTPGYKLRTQWSSATLIKTSATQWVVVGDVTA